MKQKTVLTLTKLEMLWLTYAIKASQVDSMMEPFKYIFLMGFLLSKNISIDPDGGVDCNPIDEDKIEFTYTLPVLSSN